MPSGNFYYSRQWPVEIPPGLIGSPFDRIPQPKHAAFKHQGWHKNCPLCCELRNYVYEIINKKPRADHDFTGNRTEKKYYPEDLQKEPNEDELFEKLTR